MRFLLDENFNNHIYRALLLQRPELDIVRVQDVGLSGKDDAEVLAWALNDNRILLTHDVKTIPALALNWLQAGRLIPGILHAGWHVPVNLIISDLLLIVECSTQEEWAGQIYCLPL